MDARIDAAHAILSGRFSEVVEMARLAWEGGAGCRERDRAEEVGQHRGRGRATAGMTRNVVGEVRGIQKRVPFWIRAGGRVTVLARLPDRGDGPPGDVGILRVPGRNEVVREGDIELSE